MNLGLTAYVSAFGKGAICYATRCVLLTIIGLDIDEILKTTQNDLLTDGEEFAAMNYIFDELPLDKKIR